MPLAKERDETLVYDHLIIATKCDECVQVHLWTIRCKPGCYFLIPFKPVPGVPIPDTVFVTRFEICSAKGAFSIGEAKSLDLFEQEELENVDFNNLLRYEAIQPKPIATICGKPKWLPDGSLDGVGASHGASVH